MLMKFSLKTVTEINFDQFFIKIQINTNNTLLMFHGNAGPIENRFYKLNKLSKYNQNILLISWRSYSGNEGKPTRKGFTMMQ
jgi:hypothetical protein